MRDLRPASRHQSRRVALQVLYALDLARGRGEESPGSDEVFDRVAAHFDLPGRAREFAAELVGGVDEHWQPIDALLAEHARNWRLSRMAMVDRNILRLAAFELVHTETPASVVLDEAIELARRFGDEPSPAFVNGVLDSVARGVDRAAAGSHRAPAGGA